MGSSFSFLILAATQTGALILNARYNGITSNINFLLAFSILVTTFNHLKFKRDISSIFRLANLNELADWPKTLREHLIGVASTKKDIEGIVSTINEIGQEKYSEAINQINDSSIRAALHLANTNIIALRQKERNANWVTIGIAAITELKQHGNNIQEFSFRATSAIVKYLGANQAAFFINRKENEGEWLDLIASYAYNKKRFIKKQIQPGEGLVGQVYYEKEICYLTKVPADYIKITSGLGEALPGCVCIIPLLSDGELQGAIEIASFHLFEDYHFDYLRKIADSIGYTLGTMASNQRTEVLLNESQKMAAEVKSQEEELRQNMEELTATQEQMKRKEKELDAVMSSLSTVELALDGTVLNANPVFLGVTGYSLADIQTKLYKNLIPQHDNDPIQYEIMWDSIISGKSFSGEFRIINNERKEMWMAGNFTPLIGENGRPYKVMVISLFTTQDKEKLYELQETITAIKECFPIAEINQDFSFKSANDLFLKEVGVKRLELKKLKAHQIMNGSFTQLEQFIKNPDRPIMHSELTLQHTNGGFKKFESSLIVVGNAEGRKKKGLLILRNEL